MADSDRNEPEPLQTAEKVAGFLGMYPQTVHAEALASEIPSRKIGVLRRFRPAAIEDWLEEQAAAGSRATS